MIRAGFPATIIHGGTSFVTTEPAPTIAPSPMITPFSMIELNPIHALSQIFTGAQCTDDQFFSPVDQSISFLRLEKTMLCELWSVMLTPHAIITSFPIVTLSAIVMMPPPIKVLSPIETAALSRSNIILVSTIDCFPINILFLCTGLIRQNTTLLERSTTACW